MLPIALTWRRIWRASPLLIGLLLQGCGGSDDPTTPTTPTATTPVADQVTVSGGTLQGAKVDASGIYAYKGIPFAAPPVGDLRWKAPQAAAPWTGVKSATSFGANCWASSPFGGPITTTNVSEDCLYLNVWTGAASSNEKRPVMVYFHGGGFEIGSVSGNGSDGTAFAKSGVVLVTVNYRLGVFGYLARPDLDAEGGAKTSGNYGLLDMVSSLEWVKQNIATFGGDPSNVTVFGNSAGAHAIGILMASPLAPGLFHKAIGQSGAFWESEHGVMPPRTVAFNMGLALGPKMGRKTLADLRAASALELQTATNWTSDLDPLQVAFSPMVDGYVLPQNPYLTFMQGKQMDIPLMAGWNLREGLPFVARSLPHDTVTTYTQAVTSLVGPQYTNAFLALYPGSTVAEATASGELFIGDMLRYQTWGWVTQHQKTGHSPVFVYNYNYSSPYSPIPQHGAESQFVFGNYSTSAAAADVALSNQMQSYWVNFARNGNPNGTGLVQWPQYAGAGSQALSIGNTVAPAGEEGLARLVFLDNFRVDGIWTLNQQKP